MEMAENMDNNAFDYEAAVREVEDIIARVEDPRTGIPETEKLIAKAGKSLDRCYEYLRSGCVEEPNKQ